MKKDLEMDTDLAWAWAWEMGLGADKYMDMAVDMDISVVLKTAFQRFRCQIMDINKKFNSIFNKMSDSPFLQSNIGGFVFILSPISFITISD
jgi:hypothetical protein